MVQNDPDITLELVDPLGNWNYFRMNHKYPPFDNKKIRQAAMYAVGQEDVLKALIGNKDYYSTCASPYSCGTPNATDDGKDMVVPANIEKAKQLLAQAGFNVDMQAMDWQSLVTRRSSTSSWTRV